VESSDTGTSFTIYFRSSKAAVLPNREKEITLENFKGSGTILVVDDEQQQRDVAYQLLSFLGYSVETVTSGEEAISYCRNRSVDLVLLDMIMDPGINGLQTLMEIIKINPSQQAIIASGFSESDAVKETLQLGAGGFIKKPYTMEQLGKIIKKVMLC
jgi:DNA-binding NtrC family response regulator